MIIVLVHLFTLYLLDNYNMWRLNNLLRSAVTVVLSVWLAGVIVSGLLFFFPKYVFGRQVLLIHLFVASAFMVVWRLAAATILVRNVRPKRLALVGDGWITSFFS